MEAEFPLPGRALQSDLVGFVKDRDNPATAGNELVARGLFAFEAFRWGWDVVERDVERRGFAREGVEHVRCKVCW